jgi:hypothetical protein
MPACLSSVCQPYLALLGVNKVWPIRLPVRPSGLSPQPVCLSVCPSVHTKQPLTSACFALKKVDGPTGGPSCGGTTIRLLPPGRIVRSPISKPVEAAGAGTVRK